MSSTVFSSAVVIPVILILLFLCQIPETHGEFSFPVSSCDSVEKFAPNGTYQANLVALKSKLILKVKNNKGFATSTVGKGNDIVYGLVQCRGDLLSNDTCFSCMAKAAVDVEKRCINSKSAFICYDWCFVKYAPRNFFGKVDIINILGLENRWKLTENLEFLETVDGFLRGLMNRAIERRTLFAEGEMKTCEYMTLYGFVQCSQDLEVIDCTRCLNYAVSSLSYVSGLKRGGRVYFGSCQARYEIYVIPTS